MDFNNLSQFFKQPKILQYRKFLENFKEKIKEENEENMDSMLSKFITKPPHWVKTEEDWISYCNHLIFRLEEIKNIGASVEKCLLELLKEFVNEAEEFYIENFLIEEIRFLENEFATRIANFHCELNKDKTKVS